MKRLLITQTFILLMAWPFSASGAVRTGDVNSDGIVGISDVTYLIDYLINSNGQDVPVNGDVNLDGDINIGDVTSLIDLLFLSHQEETISVNGVTFTMVFVEGGTFTMGSTPEQWPDHRRNESPLHEVTLSSYYMAQTEVTQELWMAVMGYNPSTFAGDLQRPVEMVSKFACARFVDKLTELTGKVFRLPTEAEWEFAARGGNKSRTYKYSGSNNVDDVAWYVANSDSITHAVATKIPNELGIYDMSGNVLEWCQDWYYSYDYEPCVNPVGPESGYENIYRGGCWIFDASMCRNSYRDMFPPDSAFSFLGLRIVMNY